ncbi:MAG: DoxX family protein [Alphaproteobacteria bacterium]|nr:DoxX family protein [Alphaproteobacteria bacterium]
MSSETLTAGDAGRPRRGMLWGGYALSGLAVAFFLMDAAMKLMQLPVVASTGEALGWAADTALPLGVTLLVCTVLYVVPQTAVLGAVLLTGYLGGAVATHVRVASPLFSHVLFGVYLGVMVWGGLWLRDARLRAIFPLR